jgi:hypothetical protein
MALEKPDISAETIPDEETLDMKDVQPTVPLLARWAGALLIAAALFAVAAVMAFGSVGRQSVWGWAFAVLSLLTLAGWLVGRRQGEHLLRDKYARQRTLVGANALTSVLLFAVLLVGVNYIAARRHKTLDLTSNRINSLADQTYKALEQLPGPVTMTYVFTEERPNPMAQSLLNAYKNASDKVQVEYLNATINRAQLRELNLTSFTGQPMLLVELEGKQNNAAKKAGVATPPTAARQEVTAVDEQGVTSALLKLNNPQARVVYFLGGHGETSPWDFSGSRTMMQAKAALEAQNYTTKKLSLTGPKAAVPADAAALIIAGPQTDLLAPEEKNLKDYIAGKGRLVLLLSPANGVHPRWKNVASALGMQMTDGVVVDFQRFYDSPATVIGAVDDVTRHPVLRGVPPNVNIVFPGSAPLRKSNTTPAGLTITPLLESSVQSLDRLPQRGSAVRAQNGPFVLAAAVERGTPAAASAESSGRRAVIVSNADFASDQVLQVFGQASGNLSFFLATVNWTVGNEALVSIPPKPPVTNTITLSPETGRFVALLVLFALPLGVLIIGGVVWWKRR